jgi:hypothetical protein
VSHGFFSPSNARALVSFERPAALVATISKRLAVCAILRLPLRIAIEEIAESASESSAVIGKFIGSIPGEIPIQQPKAELPRFGKRGATPPPEGFQFSRESLRAGVRSG